MSARRYLLFAGLGLMLGLAACGDAEAPDLAEPGDEAEAGDEAESEEPEEAPDTDAEDPVDPAEHFAGQEVTLLHGHSPAGGYDAYSRLIAPYLAEELGADRVTVVNESGAAGLIALNRMVQADADGTTIQLINGPGTLHAVLGGEDAAEGIDPAELSWIGRIAGEPAVMTVPTDGEIKSFEDMVEAEEVRYGSSGPGSGDWILAQLLEEVYGITPNMITGFDTAEVVTAMLRGDVDAFSGTLDSRMADIESGETVPVLIQGTERVDMFPDVPHLLELPGDISDEHRAMLETNVTVTLLGRALATTPGTPPEVVEYIREALARVVEREDFLEEAEQQGRPIGFIPGGEYQDMVEGAMNAPDRYAALFD